MRSILVAAGGGVQACQSLQRGVRDRLVVDRHGPLIARPHVGWIRVRLPLDVAPIRGMGALDQHRLGVASCAEDPAHRAVEPLDERLAAQRLVEPGRIGHGVKGFDRIHDRAGFLV